MPKWYVKYQQDLRLLIRVCRIPKKDYSKIDIYFYFAYPKSTPKKKLINGAPHLKKPDVDNLTKASFDCLEKEGIINNDSQFYKGKIEKRWTTEEHGCIIFKIE